MLLTERHGTARNGTERHGTARNGTERHGTARNGTERHKLKSACIEWLNRESSFIFWMIILNLTVISGDLIFGRTLFKKLLTFGVDLAIISFFIVLLDLVLYILLHKLMIIHKTAKVFFLTVSTCIFLADIFALYYFLMPLNPVMLDVVFVTNIREIVEFGKMYFFNFYLWLIAFTVIILILIISIIFNAVLKYNKKIFFTLLLIFILAGITACIRNNFFRRERNMLKYMAVTRLYSMLSEKYANDAAFDAMINEVSKKSAITITKNESTIPYVVFILGESTSKHHMSLYNYDLPTTPNLLERQKQGRFYVFSDIISPHSYTVITLKEIFTFYCYGSKGNWFDYNNLFSIATSAGYYTVWLSNQETRPRTDPRSVFSSACSFNKFTDKFREYHDAKTSYDEKLLDFLDEILDSEYSKNFYLLQLMGNHGLYFKRYPEEYNKFSAKDETGGFDGINNAQKQIRAEYDNAVLYNDHIVNEIIKRFEDKNAIVIYLSDHGEDVYEYSDFCGHGAELPDRYIIEVPMIIWLSEKFAASYPELEARIAESVHKPYMTDDMIHTVLDIMSIETPEYDPAKSIINASFDVTRKRIYAGHVYDKEKGLIKIAVQ